MFVYFDFYFLFFYFYFSLVMKYLNGFPIPGLVKIIQLYNASNDKCISVCEEHL